MPNRHRLDARGSPRPDPHLEHLPDTSHGPPAEQRGAAGTCAGSSFAGGTSGEQSKEGIEVSDAPGRSCPAPALLPAMNLPNAPEPQTVASRPLSAPPQGVPKTRTQLEITLSLKLGPSFGNTLYSVSQTHTQPSAHSHTASPNFAHFCSSISLPGSP